MTRKLFGTDGVRGVAGELLTAELAVGLAQAATRLARSERRVQRPQVLIIRDTRESGEMLQAAVAAGVAAAGGDALLGGVLPTPAAPLLIADYGFDLAAVLSASHNPFQDNGIKFFGPDGYKLSDKTELAIERELESGFAAPAGLAPARGEGEGEGGGGNEGEGGVNEGEAGNEGVVGNEDEDEAGGAPPAIGRIRELRGAGEDYLRALHSRFAELDLSGLDVVLDCANGATYEVAPEIFRRLGARVTVLADAPDGRNINAGCGSTHIDALAAHVREGGHALGFAFDGDGDRVLAVDRDGAVVDGDELMALIALHLRERGVLPGDGVAVTVMTNYGFHTAMADAGIEVASTQVGDRYVLAELLARGWTLGGEQSGHLIELSFNRTGDGIAGALLTLEALCGRDLRERDAMVKLPQRLVNVRVRDRGALEGSAEVGAAVRAQDEALAGRGRVLVRASGTEPLVRVMVEAPTEAEADDVCTRLVDIVRGELA